MVCSRSRVASNPADEGGSASPLDRRSLGAPSQTPISGGEPAFDFQRVEESLRRPYHLPKIRKNVLPRHRELL
jgi:hypothetical protein